MINNKIIGFMLVGSRMVSFSSLRRQFNPFKVSPVKSKEMISRFSAIASSSRPVDFMAGLSALKAVSVLDISDAEKEAYAQAVYLRYIPQNKWSSTFDHSEITGIHRKIKDIETAIDKHIGKIPLDVDSPDNAREAAKILFEKFSDSKLIWLLLIADYYNRLPVILANDRRIISSSKVDQDTLIKRFMILAEVASSYGIELVKLVTFSELLVHLNPNRYQELMTGIASRFSLQKIDYQDLFNHLQNIRSSLELILSDFSEANLAGRVKPLFGHHRSLVAKGEPINSADDVLGFRIILPDESDCHQVYQAILEWVGIQELKILKNRDNITNPRSGVDGVKYKAIYLGIETSEGIPFEIQIQTAGDKEQSDKTHGTYNRQVKGI